MYIKPAFVLKWGTTALFCLLAGWLSVKWLLPILAPFILAALLALIIENPVKSLCRRGWKRETASGLCTLLLLGLIIFGTVTLLSRGIEELMELTRTLPDMFRSLSDLLAETKSRSPALPPELRVWLQRAASAMWDSFAALPARMSEKLLRGLTLAASEMPGILLFTATTGIGMYFISAALPQMQAYMDIHLPEIWQRRRLLLGSNVRFTLGRYLRAQLILMVITFFELLIGLVLLKMDSVLLISSLTAFLDALPVLGAGIVLLPWAAVNFLRGSTGAGLGLIILWAMISVMRNCIQAKLLGDQMGLHPLVTLLSIYAGWCLAGVWGMVLLPMAALMAKQLDIGSRIRRRHV